MSAEVMPASGPASGSGPPSSALSALLARATRDPNAIWMREMRQAARLGRTPWILFSLTVTISLLMCAIGGIAASADSSPATLGRTLFQVFFSIAYFVVTVVGPAIAANSIASEREGRTWEAVLLTGLSPKDITRGKFLAAFTTICLYIVVLAPVGALSFLFGGVTATEVIVAFAFLFMLAGLAVAFGLAVSSLMSSLRGAIVVTLMLAVVMAPTLHLFFGFGCSVAIHSLWPAVPEGYPIWLPLAYTRAPFGLEYVTILFVLPMLLVAIPAWFLYEVTIANLSGEADDRSSGLKRWFAVSTPILALACAAPSPMAVDDEPRMILSLFGMGAFSLFLGFSAMLFAFEPMGASRRVRIHWDREGASRWRRFFGPGLGSTSLLVALLGAAGITAIALIDVAFIRKLSVGPMAYPASFVEQVFLFAAYLAPFFVFVVGLTTWLRARNQTPWVARLITLAILFLIAAGPWVVAAIGGVMSKSYGGDWVVVAAPSPFYVFAMLRYVDRTSSPSTIIPAGLGCAALWGLLGMALLSASWRRSRRLVAAYDASVAQADAALRAEDDVVRAPTPTHASSGTAG